MYLIVVGGNDVGERLLELALKNKHDVALIEVDPERAKHINQNFDALVLNASIGTEGILDEAGARHADALIATTDDDSINLMTMVLGREYGIDNLISVVDARYHQRLFERLGVHVLVDPELIVAQHLLDWLDNPEAGHVTTLDEHKRIYEVAIHDQSAAVDQRWQDLHNDGQQADEMRLVCIERDEEIIYPDDDLRFQAGDVLVLFSRTALGEEDLSLFCNG